MSTGARTHPADILMKKSSHVSYNFIPADESLLKNSKVKYIDDTKYKDEALSKVYELNKKSFISHSLTDAVIREMLSDADLKLDYLVTYNVKNNIPNVFYQFKWILFINILYFEMKMF